MPSIPALIASLQDRGISLSLRNEELTYEAPRGAFTAADRQLLTQRRGDLTAYLAARAAALPGPMKLISGPPVPSLIQEQWWDWYGTPVRQLRQERVPLVNLYRQTSTKRLENAVSAVISRHDTLRSRFQAGADGLTVKLNPLAQLNIEQEIFARGAHDKEEGRDELERRVREFCELELPTDGIWLMRIKIIDLCDGDTLLAWVFHHTILDAGAVLLVLRELERAVMNEEVAREPRPAQFTDYALWERAWMADPARRPLTEYWAQWLRNQPGLVLQRQQCCLSWQPGEKVDLRFRLAGGVLQALNACAHRERTSLFLLMLTAFAQALLRWSGQASFALRCVGDLRNTPQLANMVGYLVCSDAVSIRAPADGDFFTLLRAVELDYHSAIQMRLPTLLRHPLKGAGSGVEDPRHIAPTINMFNARGHVPAGSADSADEGVWPPYVARSGKEVWPVLLPTLYLRLIDYGEVLQGSLEINASLLDQGEQDALLQHLFTVLREITPP